MQFSELDLYFQLDEPDNSEALAARVAQHLGVAPKTLPPLEIKRRAIDARHQKVRFLLTIGAVSEDPTDIGSNKLTSVDSYPSMISCFGFGTI